jgi:hypothetical protein
VDRVIAMLNKQRGVASFRHIGLGILLASSTWQKSIFSPSNAVRLI